MPRKGRPEVKEPKTYADPAIKEFIRLLRISAMSHIDFAKKSGLSRDIIYDWLNEKDTRISNLRVALNTLGYDLVVVKKG